MVREYHRVLSGAFSSHIYLREPKFAREWMVGVSMCELSCALGVPVIQSFFTSALAALGSVKRVREHPFREYFMQGAWFATLANVKPVTMEARLSFERAFGVAVDDQLRLEESFSSISFGGDWKLLGHISTVSDLHDCAHELLREVL
jgi:hypothetical protein